ncbi:MAG: hypothetical protein ACP5H2_00035 [Solirubrobacteraceae bacterium]
MALTRGVELYTEPDGEISERGIEVSGSQLAVNNLKPDLFHGQCNQTIPHNRIPDTTSAQRLLITAKITAILLHVDPEALFIPARRRLKHGIHQS